jgi:signal transduction histidine kinase
MYNLQTMTDQDQTKRIERLLEVSRALSASRDAALLLDTIVSAASELTGCEMASILELEDGGAGMHFLAVPWFHREALKALTVPVQGSVAGWVASNGKPLIVPDAAREIRHFKGADQAAEFCTRSLIAVPVFYQGETLGVLESVNKAGDASWSGHDLATLETLASYAAIAIQNTRLMGKVQKAVDELSQLDRMKSEFIAIASHELRTPLGLILGHATFLREVIQADYRPQLDIIVRNSMRLKEIIDNIANIDNIQRGTAILRRHMISLKRVVEEARDTFYEEARKKGLSLRAETGPEELLVEGDAAKIALALSNLVKNSITFTDPGGNILIFTEQIPGYVKVSVIDDGIGIPSTDLPHIFERFYQVESHLTRKHGGMGLGLSVARLMIEMHGGRIWAESLEGKGSNFTFLLPLEPTPSEPPSA